MSNPPSKPDAAKPAAVKASAGKPADAQMPDAALLDRDGDADAGDAPAPAAKTGLRRFLPSSALGWVVAASILLITLGGSTAGALLFVSEPKTDSSTLAGPARALDGSTLVVAGQTVRLQGIEAPPASLVCRDGGWEYKCGEDSRRALEQEIQGRTVECLRSNDTPASAQCFNDQGVDLAAALVESGWAVIDFKRSSRYMPQQVRAQNGNRGLWRNDFALSEQWRLAGSRGR